MPACLALLRLSAVGVHSLSDTCELLLEYSQDNSR